MASASFSPATRKNVVEVSTLDALAGCLIANQDALKVLFFYADFHAPSKPGGQMDTVVTKLAEVHPSIVIARVREFDDIDAEAASEVAEQFDVAVVPTFVFFKRQVMLGKLEGADAAELTRRVERLKDAAPPSEEKPLFLAEVFLHVNALVASKPVVLFMKGTPEEPKCKFSRRIVDILNQTGAEYSSFDILSSEAVRQAVKLVSNWPTYPQLYVDGKLIGGVDITEELQASGELRPLLLEAAAAGASPSAAAGQTAAAADLQPSVHPTVGSASPLAIGGSSVAPVSGSPADGPALDSDRRLRPHVEARLRALLASAPVVLAMKGSADAPACGFSATMVKLLRAAEIPFTTHDILADPQAREGLKVLNNWPTFPQLFVRGELVGGLDVVQAMLESGEPLAKELGIETKEPLNKRLARLLNQAHVTLFMKGSPAAPRCGFSAEAIRLLTASGFDPLAEALLLRGGKPSFAHFDILGDEEVRQGLKAYSNWPTYPQLYVNGELLGGLDIMKEMGAEELQLTLRA